VSASSDTTAGAPIDVTVTALDANNNVVSNYRGTVHFTTTDTGTGVVLPSDYTFTSADQGAHTFFGGVTLVTVGPQTVTATDTSNPALTGTTTITVHPASAQFLTVTGFPSSITAGTLGFVTVTAYDAYGNVAADYSGPVHFSSSDPLAVLPNDNTLSQGHGFFAITLNTVGTQSITVSDLFNPFLFGTESGIQVSNSTALPPVVAGLDPPFGPTGGGSTTIVFGSNLANASAVYFGSTPAFIIDSAANWVDVVVPPGPLGVVDVTVVTPGGTSAVTPADQFTYQGGGFGPSVRRPGRPSSHPALVSALNVGTTFGRGAHSAAGFPGTGVVMVMMPGGAGALPAGAGHTALDIVMTDLGKDQGALRGGVDDLLSDLAVMVLGTHRANRNGAPGDGLTEIDGPLV
jgi:hypothetical protein